MKYIAERADKMEKFSGINVYILSLGCAKNLVDSEVMSGVLDKYGFAIVDNPKIAQVIIINTCGFIEAAKKESIAAILELAEYKQDGCCELLVCAGCMADKYREDLAEALPELDAFVSPGDFAKVAQILAQKMELPMENLDLPHNSYLLRRRSAPDYSAYLKIAEGCDNHCTYCLIPQLKGRYCSRPMEDILAEAADLADQGIKELILIAQDTTRYGLDLYGKRCLAQLVDKIAELPIPFIRILYVYPSDVDAELLSVMAAHDNICKYLDIPVQHGDDSVLKGMNRRGTKQGLLDKIALIREYLPDVVLRTTIIVGFPGETEENFANMLDFLHQAQFDWLGAFPYYQEMDTPAAEFTDQIDEDIKQQRLDITMSLAAEITASRLQKQIGKIVDVVVEGSAEQEYAEGWYKGRSYAQAPEVDGLIYFAGAALQPGKMLKVKIVSADTYDLMGEII